MRAYWGIALVFVLFGFVIGLGYRDVAGISVEPTVTLGQLVQALVTLALAVVVSKWWRDAHYRSDTAKDLLIESLGRVRLGVSSLESSAVLLSGNWTALRHAEVVRLNRSLSNALTEIEVTARAIFDESPCIALRTAVLEVKRVTTAGTQQNPPSRVNIDHAVARLSVEIGNTQAAILRL